MFERFLHAAALGDDVFDDEHFFAGGDDKSAAQDQFAVVIFFRENKARAELAGDLLSDDQAAHRRGNDGGGGQGPDFGGQGGADFLDDGHFLQGEGALEVEAAVQTAAQNKVAFQQRAGLAKNLHGLVLRHAPFIGGRGERLNDKVWRSRRRRRPPHAGRKCSPDNGFCRRDAEERERDGRGRQIIWR